MLNTHPKQQGTSNRDDRRRLSTNLNTTGSTSFNAINHQLDSQTQRITDPGPHSPTKKPHTTSAATPLLPSDQPLAQLVDHTLLLSMARLCPRQLNDLFPSQTLIFSFLPSACHNSLSYFSMWVVDFLSKTLYWRRRHYGMVEKGEVGGETAEYSRFSNFPSSLFRG